MSYWKRWIKSAALLMALIMPIGNTMAISTYAQLPVFGEADADRETSAAEIEETESNQEAAAAAARSEESVSMATGSNAMMHKVTFMVNNEEYHTLSVLHNKPVTEPAVPSLPAGMNSFLGWFTEGDDRYDFSSVITADLTLYGKFSEMYLVQYLVDGKIVDSALAPAGVNLIPSDYQPVPPEGSYFIHWYEQGKSEEEGFDFQTGVNRNIVLVPYFAYAHYVFFYSEGTTVPEQLVYHGDKILPPDTPRREGYNFTGWALDSAGEQPFDADMVIMENITLYAQWEALMVEYTVVYWVEKANLKDKFNKDDASDYFFAYAEKKQALAGEMVTAGAADDSVRPGAMEYSDFYRGSSGVILGNGTTVLNVYYTRTIYTIYFDLNKSPIQNYFYLAADGTLYQDGGEQYSITAKYEDDISEIWPVLMYDENFKANLYAVPQNGIPLNQVFTGWYPAALPGLSDAVWITKRLSLTANMIPDEQTEYTVTAQWSTAVQLHYVNYMVEAINQDEWESDGDGIKKYQDVVFLRDTSLSQYLYQQGGPLSLKDIEGLIPHETGPDEADDETGVKHLYLYYFRERHSLMFDTQGGDMIEPQTEVLYQQSLKDLQPADPQREGYDFTGWYYDVECREAFDFGTATMPAGDLMIFAGWQSNDHTVTFYETVNGEAVKSTGVKNSGFVTPPAEYEVGKGYEDKGVFQGWYWYNGSRYMAFSFEMPITQDISLYGAWQTEGFRLSYSDNGATAGTVPEDEMSYALNQLALVKKADLIRDGQRFIGWQLNGSGRTYYPGNTLEMYQNLELLAAYEEPEIMYRTLTFNANGGIWGDGATEVDWVFPEGTSHISLAQAPKFVYQGYNLLGWSEDMEAITADYQPLGTYIGPLEADIILYAVWQPEVELIVAAPDLMVTYDGQEHFAFAETNMPQAEIFYKDEDGQYTLTMPPTYIKAGSYQMEFMATHRDYGTVYGQSAVIIEPETLTITAEDKRITERQAIPVFSYSMDGFVMDEDETVLNSLPMLSTRYVRGQGYGVYDITISENLTAENYQIIYVHGKLTVTRVDDSGGGSEETGSPEGPGNPGGSEETAAPETIETQPIETKPPVVIRPDDVPLLETPVLPEEQLPGGVPKTNDKAPIVLLLIILSGAAAVISKLYRREQ